MIDYIIILKQLVKDFNGDIKFNPSEVLIELNGIVLREGGLSDSQELCKRILFRLVKTALTVINERPNS